MAEDASAHHVKAGSRVQNQPSAARSSRGLLFIQLHAAPPLALMNINSAESWRRAAFMLEWRYAQDDWAYGDFYDLSAGSKRLPEGIAIKALDGLCGASTR